MVKIKSLQYQGDLVNLKALIGFQLIILKKSNNILILMAVNYVQSI